MFISDPRIKVTLLWPKGTYALPETTSGCPSHEFDEGCRYQDSEDKDNKNKFHGTHLLRGIFSKNMEMCYCVIKHDNEKSNNLWPAGTYCIAKKGESPDDEHFRKGEVHWDDEDKSNINRVSGELPDGKYDKNTKIEYWCRNDGSPHEPILLPTQVPFVLYQYSRWNCQKVLGMTTQKITIHSDDENKRNHDRCQDDHPYSETSCRKDQRLHLCYYSMTGQKQQLTTYTLVGDFKFMCGNDAGKNCEPYGNLVIEFSGRQGHGKSQQHQIQRYEIWQVKAGHMSYREKREYRLPIKETISLLGKLQDQVVTLYGRVMESDSSSRDDVIGKCYNNKKIRAKSLLHKYHATHCRGGRYVRIVLRLYKK